MVTNRKKSGRMIRARFGDLCTTLLLLVLFLPLLNCATYWQNRLKDSGDLVSAGYQDESYGLSFRAGPAKLGMHYKSSDGIDAGYRQGYSGRFQSQSFVALVLGSDVLQGPLKKEESSESSTPPSGKKTENKTEQGHPNEPSAQDLENLRNMSLEDIKKLPAFQNLSPEQQAKFIEQFKKMKEGSAEDRPAREDGLSETTGPPSEMEIRSKTYQAKSPLGTSVPFKEKSPLLKSRNRQPVSQGFAPGGYLTSIELKAGIYSGFYLAIHLGEFVDLLAGFIGLDPMSDDGPFEMGMSGSELEDLTEAERELIKTLGPEQRKQFLNLSPEERRVLLERMKQR